MEQVELFPEEESLKRPREEYEEEYDDSELLLAESKEPRLEFNAEFDISTELPSTELPKKWTPQEDQLLTQAVNVHGNQWKKIAAYVPGKSPNQCLQHWRKVLNPSLKKGPWSNQEDTLLSQAVTIYKDAWTKVCNKVPGRTAKQCRERWVNVVDPSLIDTPWTDDENAILLESYSELRNKWALIAKRLPGRSETAVHKQYKYLTQQEGGEVYMF